MQSPRGKWWKVRLDTGTVSVQGLTDDNELVMNRACSLTGDEEYAVLRMEAEEERRLALEEDSAECGFELEHDENTEWLRTSEWPRWFQNRPLHIISAASKIPSVQNTAYAIGQWAGEELISPAVQETTLRRLMAATDSVLQRCEETLQSTPRSLRCWIKSSNPSVSPRPFETPQRKQSRRRYCSYWKRFLCYIFRAHLISRAYGLKMQEIFGLQLSRPQIQMVEFVYTAAAELNDDDAAAFAILKENMFQLFAMFWTDISRDGRMETCALVHFTGVLGIHPQELAYRTAYAFTPALSALIWIGRLILLEYALPLQAYSYLKLPWPTRTQYPDQVQRLRDQIHPKYMRRGCFSPLGYMCERMHHARTIANREGPRTNISWSADLQVLSIADQTISLSQLRQAAHLAVARTEGRAKKLMLGSWPKVDLSKIKDSLVTHRPGHSFLSESENQLQMSFKFLSRQAFSKEGGFSLMGPGRQRAVQYLRDRDDFIKHLFGAIHIPSGMPARSEELRMVRWADTTAVSRNIFVHQGRLILIFSYNKATTVSSKSFYIVRFPCRIIEHVLFLYLTYIRPFCDFLARQLQLLIAPSTNPHLFTLHDSEKGCFSTTACLRSLQLSTRDCGVQLSIQLYRQVVISVVKKHISSLIVPFNPDAPTEYAAFLKTLAYQTGHTIQTHSRSYALEENYPGKLQSDLIERYYQSSLLWQRFLNLSDGDPLLVQLSTEGKLVETPSQAISYAPDLSVVGQEEEPEDVEIEIDAEVQADDSPQTPGFEEEAVPANERPIQTGENQKEGYTPKRIRAEATGSVEGSGDESIYIGRHSTRSGGKKRKRTNAFRDRTSVDPKEVHIAAGRYSDQTNKKQKQDNGPGNMILERLLQMQEELGRMIAAHEKKRVV